MAVKIKRAYESPAVSDGKRVLVDRLWPRGISKEKASIDEWVKELAPSDELRKWFAHKPERWDEFRRRYRDELQSSEKQALLKKLNAETRERTLTLVYGAKDTEHNNARALAELLR